MHRVFQTRPSAWPIKPGPIRPFSRTPAHDPTRNGAAARGRLRRAHKSVTNNLPPWSRRFASPRSLPSPLQPFFYSYPFFPPPSSVPFRSSRAFPPFFAGVYGVSWSSSSRNTPARTSETDETRSWLPWRPSRLCLLASRCSLPSPPGTRYRSRERLGETGFGYPGLPGCDL